MNKLMAMAVILGAGVASAQEPKSEKKKQTAPPPPVLVVEKDKEKKAETQFPIALKLSEDAADLALRYSFGSRTFMQLTPFVHGGVLAPFGGTSHPYSILGQSPYAMGGAKVEHTGNVEAMGIGTVGYLNMRTHKGIPDPDGGAASPASSLRKQHDFSQQWMNYSAYGDVGTVLTVAPKLKTAFWIAADAFAYQALGADSKYGAGDGMVEANIGNLWMYKTGRNEVSLVGDLRLEGASKTMYRNGDYTVSPAGTVGAEYAYDTGSSRIKTGVETSLQPADLGLRPYVGWSNSRVDTTLAGNFRRSRNDFYPDVMGMAAEVKYKVTPGVQVGVLGNYSNEKFAMAPGPEQYYSAMGTLTIEIDRLFKSESSYRARRAPVRTYRPSDSTEMNSRLPGAAYAATFRQALNDSQNFEQFVKRIPLKGTDDILAAVSAFTSSFGNSNYNNNEGNPDNVNSIEELYKRGRASYLTGKDDPILVCIGSSQFAAVLAEELGKQAGVPIQAMATTVSVPDKKGVSAGHAVAAIKTKEYGIVFVDWGQLTPTHTYDTRMALRIYQALQGVPEIMHAVTDGRDGRHVGYLFSEEGKIYVRNLTFHSELPQSGLPRLFDDDPRGHDTSIERYRDLTRKKF